MKNTIKGKKGEEIAANFLIKNGYDIIERNWHFRHKEIDLIASKEDMLVIVEVKYRKTDVFENPQDAVTKKKQKFIISATSEYIRLNEIDLDTRFDIISIVDDNEKPKINHIKDAFYPTL